MENQDFAARFLALRRKKGWSQREIAVKLGVTYRAISKWENGRGTPRFSLLPIIASIFEVSFDELLGDIPRKEEKI